MKTDITFDDNIMSQYEKTFINQSNYINFDNNEVNQDWAFCSIRSTEQLTHGYHCYPAQFLPNVVKMIVEDNSSYNCEGVTDLFASSGTTLVEAG